MRLHRFYISEIVGNRSDITINSADMVNQVRRVFRLKTGDEIIVYDGSGFDYRCSIKDLSDEAMSLMVAEIMRSRFMPSRQVVLCASIVKKDTFEWIVEKATELGVSKIIPVISERSEKKLLNMDRLRKIATEASEQSGRGDVPVIGEIINFSQLLSMEDGGDRVAFHTEAELFDDGLLSNEAKAIAVFIGPEGGWSQKEIDLFHENKIPVRSVGRQVLRAETAVVAILSKVLLD